VVATTMEAENQPGSIEQWYKRATALDGNWRESRREEKKLKGRREQMGGTPKLEQRQILPQPLVWQRRQMPPQQVTTRPALVEGVERTNAVMVREPGQEMGAPPRRNPYAMEVDRRRNCYACGGFGHIACHCRNWRRVVKERRLEFKGNYKHSNSLKEEENLESLD